MAVASKLLNKPESGNNNRAAAAWMLVGGVAGSFLGLIVEWGETNKYPFFFTAVHNFVALCFFLGLIKMLRPALFSKKIIRIALEPTKQNKGQNWYLLGCIISALVSFPLFAIATKFIDVVAVVVIFEAWPIILVLLTGRLFRRDKRFNKLRFGGFFIFLLALVGLFFIMAGQSQNFTFSFSDATVFGSSLAVIAAFCNALSPACSIKHGAVLRKNILRETGEDIGEFFCTFVSVCVQRSIGGILGLCLALFFGEYFTTRGFIAGAMIGLMVTITSIGIRKANLLTTNLGVNALLYVRPIFALIWLLLFTTPDYLRVDFLVIGAVIIIVSNHLLNSAPSIRPAYKALIIALWACGAWVYLHTSFAIPDYFITVEIASVLFILLLSFRMDRLVRRTTDEEKTTLLLFRKLGTFAQHGKIAAHAPESLRVVDSYQNSGQLREAYNNIKDALSVARKESPERAEVLDEVEAELDQLAHSKQQGKNFGELTALGFIGVMLAVTLLFFEPENLTGWNGFLVEVSSVILASVVLFLFFSVHDLQNDRNRPIVEEREKTPAQYSVLFRDATDREFERIISVIVCLAITLSYSWLFFVKWL